jgi:hypothetical protein
MVLLLQPISMSQQDSYGWSKRCLGRDIVLPSSEFPTSSTIASKYACRQLFYHNHEYLLIIASKLLPSRLPYCGGASSPFDNSLFDVQDVRSAQGLPIDSTIRRRSRDYWLNTSMPFSDARIGADAQGFDAVRSTAPLADEKTQLDHDARFRYSPHHYPRKEGSLISWPGSNFLADGSAKGLPNGHHLQGKVYSQRQSSNRDEFDGPHQLLERPSGKVVAAQEEVLPYLPTHLCVNEQDEILLQVNDRLSKCAFDFVARYQFPIPLESDKRLVRIPADREWTEWACLLKRMATKRRVPARVLYHGQIKQFVTVLNNSLIRDEQIKHCLGESGNFHHVKEVLSPGGKNFLSATRRWEILFFGGIPAAPAAPAPLATPALTRAPGTKEEEIPQKERLHLAHEAWKAAAHTDNPLSVRKVAKKYGLNPSTLQGRINGAISSDEKDARAQKLNPQEEEALVK